jgi:hypothetical protein
VGLIAWSAGILGTLHPIAARELVSEFQFEAIRREGWAFGEQELAWLMKAG